MTDAQEMLIARPGDLILPSQLVPLQATRVGGLPAYPQGCEPLKPTLMACGACGAQLTLILQAYAPLDIELINTSQPERYIYLYGCLSEGCGKQPECWKAIRIVAAGNDVQSRGLLGRERSVVPVPVGQPAATSAEHHWGVGSGAAEGWGVSSSDDWDIGSSEDAAAAAESSFHFADLNAALEAAGKRKADNRAAKPRQSASKDAAHDRAAACVYDANSPVLPAFYLYAEAEPQCAAAAKSHDRTTSQAEQEHLARLLAAYEEQEGATVHGHAPSGGTTSAPSTTAAAACTPSDDGGHEAWGSEGYEDDVVLVAANSKRAGLDAAFLKFSKQLARCPDQCARYKFGGCPMWPTAQPPPVIQPCSRCGGPRLFEMQVMSPLIPALLESADWLVAEGVPQAAAVLKPPDSWAWMTVCMYTCRASCAAEQGITLAAEAVVLANEE